MWNAVQAQRDREREEQMLQQRQQQHYQNITTQQMFPKSPDAVRAASASGAAMMEATTPPAALGDPLLAEQGNGNGNGITLAVFAQQLDNKVASEQSEQEQADQESRPLEEACVDQTDAGSSVNGSTTTPSTQAVAEPEPEVKVAEPKATNGTAAPVSVSAPVPAASPAPAPAPITPAATPPPAAPVKKEKLGGFLPNGCIFPRFKNNKNKDKDGGSHKEGKSKEKTLLNALKKSKEKKVAPSEQPTEKVNASDNGTTQYEKNCLNNLECEVQKLDLNSGSNGENGMFIKLTAAAAAK